MPAEIPLRISPAVLRDKRYRRGSRRDITNNRKFSGALPTRELLAQWSPSAGQNEIDCGFVSRAGS